ncbi:hypothetical protein DT076_16515 [Desertihabitans brevis]|uniref:Right handed beta helix domain-containing protein n=1 Tax=Desertihabitans brevis TaxID=2268447 RepID=A0A367YT97_9ACTN|nr:hypothetical protein DT076_16515 [Desertihabitans brevis]
MEWHKTALGLIRLGRSVVDRDALVGGNYMPGPGTTGVIDETTLTLYNGGQNFNPSGSAPETFEGYRYQGMVYLNCSNKTFRNCLFEGPASPTGAIVQGNYDASSGNTFEDCTFRPRTANDVVNCVQGRGLTLRRCDISGGVDGAGATRGSTSLRSDVVVEQCWIHDLLYYRPSDTHADGQTHSDAIQWHGGLGLTVRYNRIEGFSPSPDANRPDDGAGGGAPFYPLNVIMSLLMVNGTASAPTGELLVEGNWMDGGFVLINAQQTANCLTTGPNRIIGNRFGDAVGYTSPVPHILSTRSDKQIEFTGNTHWDKAIPLATGTAANHRVNV